MDQYTHKFVFSISDGGKFLKGKCEFDTDDKLSFKFTQFSEPISEQTMNHFMELMAVLHKIYDSEGGIEEIKIVEDATQ